MEVIDIDWKNIDSKFVFDDLYEHINAPKWLDFLLPDQPIDDEAWFCRPDCKHPRTVADFQKSSPVPKVKILRSPINSEISPLGDRNNRDSKLKRRGVLSTLYDLKTEKSLTSKGSKFREEGENENPNISSSMNHRDPKQKREVISSSTASLSGNAKSGSKSCKSGKESENENPNCRDPKLKTQKILSENARSRLKPLNSREECRHLIASNTDSITQTEIKLRTEKVLQPPNEDIKDQSSEVSNSKERKKIRSLKSSSSARNLFAGRDILNHISEFCSELKKMASFGNQKRTTQGEFSGESTARLIEESQQGGSKRFSGEDSVELPGNDGCSVTESLLPEENRSGSEKRIRKEKHKSYLNSKIFSPDMWKKKRNEGMESRQRGVGMEEREIINNKEEEGGLLPLQARSCPPTPQRITKATPPLSSFKSKTDVRGVVRETKTKEGSGDEDGSVVIVDGEARSIDVFWFLKPCTYLAT